VEHSVVDFIQFRLLRCAYHVAAFHRTNELVLLLRQAFGLSVAEQLVELLLTGITSAVYACCFAKPVNGSLDACGGCNLLNGSLAFFRVLKIERAEILVSSARVRMLISVLW
jgi:hypothetical protein